LPLRIGKPRHIVSPLVVEVVIQEDGRKQAEIERGTRSEPLDDLPGSEIFFVRVGPCEIEIELVSMNLGEEVATAGERLQIKELVFFEAVHGFYVALVGVSCRGNPDMLAVPERGGEITFELPTVVGLPDQVTERDAVTIQVLLDARSEDGAGGGTALLGKGPEQQTAAHVAGGVLDDG
jgi:hypothetical protein